jgi:hypothetical protein
MSITDQNRTNPPGVDDRDIADRRTLRRNSSRWTWRETKPSPKTTELWLTVIGIAAIVVIYNASRDASLDLFRACLLGTVMAAAYVVSRGFAKAGSHDDDVAQYTRD